MVSDVQKLTARLAKYPDTTRDAPCGAATPARRAGQRHDSEAGGTAHAMDMARRCAPATTEHAA
jgi:hypothetical protein